jgi:hypothetical protein
MRIPEISPLLGLLLAFTAGCATEPSTPPECEDLCRELVDGCGFEAFPSGESCRRGCAFEDQEGADLDDLSACIADAACDPFTILRCQRSYGSR